MSRRTQNISWRASDIKVKQHTMDLATWMTLTNKVRGGSLDVGMEARRKPLISWNFLNETKNQPQLLFGKGFVPIIQFKLFSSTFI